jgi:hypothetical protein
MAAAIMSTILASLASAFTSGGRRRSAIGAYHAWVAMIDRASTARPGLGDRVPG